MANLFGVAGTGPRVAGGNGIPLGSTFIAHQRLENTFDLYGGMTPEEFQGWMFQRFREAYAAKKPEIERLKLNELYYSGFHFIDPQQNRENKVTNMCFATVETVHPVMTEQKPRPEIVMRRQYQDDVASTIQEYAQWVMDTTEFDLCYHLNTREKLKYGWCVTLLVVDPRTGMCWPKVYSVFDFYKDPFARHEDEMEYFFLAAPVPTSWLRATYPQFADRIVSDNIASPGYDVLEKPYFDAYGTSGDYNSLESAIGGRFTLEGPLYSGQSQDVQSGGQPVVSPEAGTMENAGTTFLIQMFVRDRRLMAVHYTGDIATPNPPDESGMSSGFTHVPSADNWIRHEPCTPSGWVCCTATASGVMLPPYPVDPCFMGIPVEIGRDYGQAGRFYCPGEQDMLIPINRSVNRRNALLNRSLEYEAVPVLVSDVDTGIDVDKTAIEPGDVLKKQRGSDIRWLEFRGAASQQFEMVQQEKLDAQQITGVQDVSQGRRPEGIEAAAAIRNLQDAAQTRIRGKEGPAFIEWTRVLKKMLVATGKKCKERIYFRGRNGESSSIDPAWLCYEYDIRFARGTGSVLGRATNEEKYMNMAGAGLIDRETALEALDVPNIPTILKRLALEAQIQQNAAATAGKGKAA